MVIDILIKVLDDLRRHDYEHAMTELSDYEGGVFDRLKALISAKMYREAEIIIRRKIDLYIIARGIMFDY